MSVIFKIFIFRQKWK